MTIVDARVPPLETVAWTAPQKCTPRSRYLAKCGHVVLAKLYNDKQFNKNRPPCRLHGWKNRSASFPGQMS